MIGWYMSRTNDSVWLIAIVVQLLSHFWLFEIPWTVACHASCPSLSPRVYSNSFPLSCWSHATITSPDIHFSSCPQPFPASWSFQMSRLFASGGQSIEVSASASILAMNIQGCFSLGLTGSPFCPRDSQESSPAPQFESISSFVFSLLYGPTLTSVHNYWKNHSFTMHIFVGKVMSMLFNMLSRLIIAFLPRSKRLLIS